METGFELMLNKIKTALLLLFFMGLLLGCLYPLFVAALGHVLFPWQANGSLIANNDNNKVIGSLLIGQYFSDPKYFWGRMSATLPYPYNAQSSKGSNFGPSNPKLIEFIKQMVTLLQNADSKVEGIPFIPIDLVTASASGVDPDISPRAAYYQIPRIAKVRNIAEQDLHKIINQQIKPRFLGILGEARVNVLELNLLLDKIQVSKVQR